jgi:hypothetical protein
LYSELVNGMGPNAVASGAMSADAGMADASMAQLMMAVTSARALLLKRDRGLIPVAPP